MDQPFESRVLPFFMKRTQDITACLPQLYLHGLSLGDFDQALAGLLGDDAPVSPGTVARLKGVWHEEYQEWQSRPMKGKPWEYVFFIDLEGHEKDENVGKALDEAAAVADSYKVLGSFPRAFAADARSAGRGQGE